jgi:hypothetical protein
LSSSKDCRIVAKARGRGMGQVCSELKEERETSLDLFGIIIPFSKNLSTILGAPDQEHII